MCRIFVGKFKKYDIIDNLRVLRYLDITANRYE